MESLLARALESKLKYWLRSFTRDQFKLQGRSVQLHNLDVNGEVLHSTLGLPPSLAVTQARVGKLELQLPYVSNVKVEPIVVDIDKLDLVLTEKLEFDASSGNQPSAPAKSTSYGFADQIADGMTIQVGVVNMMLETRGGSRDRGSAAWTPPLASITMRGLSLYTTNENWEVVNLKEARNFSADKKSIYVFKKLEWQSISVDLLPHPDMFVDERILRASFEGSRRDSDGARRLFFGGERFLDNISGTAYITMHRTEQNNSLGLEVQLLLPEVLCPSLSEPGLRALLRFMTGFYVCLNRGDVDPASVQVGESPSATLVSVTVEHIFLRISDADFRLELLAQSLQYKRASIPEGSSMKTLCHLALGGLFLRDTFSKVPCTLVQPSMLGGSDHAFLTPTFASETMWPSIYPLLFQETARHENPLLTMYSSQFIPSPSPPTLTSQTVIQCQPLQIYLQEQSCLQIASFLADSIVLEPGVVRPNTSVNATHFSLRQLDLTVPLKDRQNQEGFTGARLHAENFTFAESPELSYKLLKLDEDPACFSFWRGQAADSSQKRLVVGASCLSIALETSQTGASEIQALWNCIEMREPCLEAAMVTADGLPLLSVPPSGGVVRLGISWKHFISNTSVEQLLFVLDMVSYLGEFGQALFKVDTRRRKKELSRSKSVGELVEAAPADSAVTLALDYLELRFLESLPGQDDVEGPEVVKFVGSGIDFRVSHKTLGGAIAVSSILHFQTVRVECVDTDHTVSRPASHSMRAIFWVHDGMQTTAVPPKKLKAPFLDIESLHMLPYKAEHGDFQSLKVRAKISGVRLGGGMIYTESLLHRFGIIGPDGAPGKDLSKIVKSLSNGPLAHLLQSSHVASNKDLDSPSEPRWELQRPDEVELDVQLIDWLFALEGAERVAKLHREASCWHSAFHCLRVVAGRKTNGKEPQRVKVSIDGLQVVKPRTEAHLDNGNSNPAWETSNSGVGVEVRLLEKQEAENGLDLGLGEWIVESIRATVKQPMDMEATKDELDRLFEIAKAEMEAASRIAVAVLRLLQLQESIGEGAIQQLSSLGSGSLSKLKSSRRDSICSTGRSSEHELEPTVAEQLEQCVCVSMELVKKLQHEGVALRSPVATANLYSLTAQLAEMQDLLRSAKIS